MSATLQRLYEDFNPFRELDWRERRARQLFRERRPVSRRNDDHYVREQLEFLRRMDKAGEDPNAQLKVFRRFPNLTFADMLRKRLKLDDQAILQARILSRQPDEEIARRMATLPLAIEYYSKLYFDVQDRLDCDDWVRGHILTRAWREALSEEDYHSPERRRATYLLYGYYGGPQVLDLMITGFNSVGPRPDTPGKASDWLDAAFESGLRRTATYIVGNMHISRYQVQTLLGCHVQLRAAEKALQASLKGSTQQTHLGRIAEEFLATAAPILGRLNQSRLTAEAREYQNSGVEPSNREMSRLLRGKGAGKALAAQAAFERPSMDAPSEIEDANG